MWIEIGDDIVCDPLPISPRWGATIEAVALASFRGRHVLFGSRNTLAWLLRQEISAASKAAIRRAHAKWAELAALREKIQSRLVIAATAGLPVRSIAGDWTVPIDALELCPYQASEVLAENLRDANVFRISADHYRRYLKVNGWQVNLVSKNGGGTQIHPCFCADIASNASISFAITDSDRDHPNAPMTAVSRACANEANSANWVCAHLELPCREVENLLPFNLVADSTEAVAGGGELVQRLRRVETVVARRADALTYADLKEGTRGYHTTESDTVAQRRTYWSGIRNSCAELGLACCDDLCRRHVVGDCECHVVDSLGPNTVDHFLQHCQGLSGFKQMERVMTSINRDQWLQVGRHLFSWGIAEQPIRA